MDKVIAFLKKWWPTIAPVLGLIWAQASPSVLAWISAHADASLAVAVLYSILAHLKSSPVAKSN
jgi:hypothetical protein